MIAVLRVVSSKGCNAKNMGYLEFVMSAFHDLKLKALDGQALPLAPFKGQVVLVVNVASKWV